MAYIGSTPTSQNFISGTDYFNGTGSQTAFTLTRSVNSVNDVEVVVNNVIQQPNSYTVSGTTLTLSAAPSSGTSNVYVRYLATNQQSFTVGNNTVGYNQLTADMQSKFAMKNRIINGAMVIDQRNAGAAVTIGTSSTGYTLDRFFADNGSDAVLSYQQVSDAPAGFVNSMKVTVSTADSSITATQYSIVSQRIEGYNVADLNFGSANAKTITVSFWVKSSVTGTFGGSITNGAYNRGYPYSFTINAANTWEQKTVTITGDTTGTWLTTNGIGMRIYFSLGAGTDNSGTANAWGAAGYMQPTGSVALINTVNATYQITGVQLEVGSSATGFEYRQYGQELALCQRYYSSSYAAGVVPGTNFGSPDGASIYQIGWGAAATSAIAGGHANLPVTMRANPSVFVYDQAGTLGVYTGLNAGAGQTNGQSFNSVVGCANSVRFRTYNTGFYGFAVSWVAVAEL